MSHLGFFFLALGVGMLRESGSIMVGQYFKKRRELVETLLCASSGLGAAAMAICVDAITRYNASIRLSVFVHAGQDRLRFVHLSSLGWRLGLQAVTVVSASPFILGLFYRSATLYHPQRRAILHLKSQKRKITIKNGHGRAGDQGDLSLRAMVSSGGYLRRPSVQAIFLSAVIAAAGATHTHVVYLVS